LSRNIFVILAFAAILSLAQVVSFQPKGSFAQSVPSVSFSNVVVDTNPTTNREFRINATISVNDPYGRNVQLGIAVPSGLTVTSPEMVNLGTVPQNTKPTASWTVIASSPGSYNATIIAYSNPSTISPTTTSQMSDSATFHLNFSVGSPKSLVVTGVNIPGNIGPNDIFPVGISLKNTGASPESDVIVSISAPSGLRVLQNVAKNIALIEPDQQVSLNWTMRADTAGSFPVAFDYRSSDSGSGSFEATVSVGQATFAEIRPSKILLGGSDPTSSFIGPGDRDLPLVVTLTNVGTLPLYNINANLMLDEPLYWDGSKATKNGNDTQTYYAQQLRPNENIDATFFINIRSNATPGVYSGHVKILFSDGTQQYQRSYDIPVSILPRAIISISSTNAHVVANNVTQVSLSVTNNGTVTVHNLQLLPITGAYTSINTPIWIGDLDSGGKKTVSMSIFTAVQTVSLIPLPVSASYEANGKTYNNTFQIPVQIEGQPDFQVRSVKFMPSSIYSGSTGTLVSVELFNSGLGVARNVAASLELPKGFSPAWGNATSIYIGTVLPNSSFVASFYVNAANNVQSGGYPSSLILNYDNGHSSQRLDFIVAPKAQFQLLNIDDSQLYPGASNVPLKVTVNNTGSSAAQTITATLLGGNSLPGVKSTTIASQGNIDNIGMVVPGQTATMDFLINIDPSITPGSQYTSVELQWTQNGTDSFVQTLKVPYHVYGGPSYLLYYQGIPWAYVIIAVIIAAALTAFIVARHRRNAKISYTLQQDSLSEPRALDSQKALRSPEEEGEAAN
jgi:hypothetical protein